MFLCPPLTNAMMAVHTTSTLRSRTCRLTFSLARLLSYGYPTDCKSCWVCPLFSPLCPKTASCPSICCIYCVFSNSFTIHLSRRNPLGIPISKRDSLLEKCAMFREAGGALSRQPSQDNGLDGPFSSGPGKLEQVPCPQLKKLFFFYSK